MLSRELQILDHQTDLEEATARELRELAIRDEGSSQAKIEEAEQKFQGAAAARKEFLEKMLVELREQSKREAPKELAEQFDFQAYIKAGLTKGALDGAMKELNQEMNLAWEYGARGISFPSSLFYTNEVSEQAADAPTAVTNITNATPRSMAPITPMLYQRNIASFIGVDMPNVPPGQHDYPYMTAGSAVAFVGEGAGVDATALAFNVVSMLPVRVTSRVLINGEAMTRIGPELESIARRDMMLAMNNEIDKQLITGNGTAPNLKGIISQLGTAVAADGDTGAQADDDEFTYRDYRRVARAHLDDKIFREPNELRLVIGTKTMTHADGILNSNNNPIQDAYQAMESKGLSVRYSARIPAPATSARSNTKGVLQSAILISAPFANNIVMPQWEAASLIIDPYTGSQNDQVGFTLRRYINLGYRRSGATGIEGVKHLFFTLQDHS